MSLPCEYERLEESVALTWYWCPDHEVRWVAPYLHRHGHLPPERMCQRAGCTLVRVVTDPTDTIDLGRKCDISHGHAGPCGASDCIALTGSGDVDG